MTIYAGETTLLQAELADDDGKPLSPLPESVTVQVLDDAASELLAEAAMALVVEDKGTLTAATSLVLTDSAQAWKPDQWRDACVRITSGAALGAERRVRSNTATALTLETKQVVNEAIVGPLSVTPGVGDSYELHRATYRKRWTVPIDQSDRELTAVYRAKTTGGANPYLAAEKLEFLAEGPGV